MDTMQHPDEGGLGAGPARHQFRVTEHEPQSRIRRDRQALSWSRVNLNPCSAMPPQRSGAASVVVKGKLFVFGGYGGGTGRLDDFWSYSFDTATWEEVEVLSTEKPGCRENNGVVIGDGSRIFLFGGYNGTSWLNDLWMFDLDTQRWTCIQESSDPNAQPGDESSMAMGSSFSGVQHGTLVRGTVPSRRFGYVSIVHNNKFVVFGGFDGSKWLNDMYEFDFQTKTWTKIQDRGTLPSARSCPAWAKDETHVYIMGGYDGVERKADFFACDLATYTWTEMICRGTPPSPRYFHSCCLYGNKIITYGGYSGSERLSDMYFYDFETNHWSEMDCTNGDRPSGRSSLVAQVYEDNLYIMFGYNGVTVLNDFYKFRLKPVSVPPSALVSDLLRLVNNPELSDISFLVEGQEVHANRAILATRSEYFKVMLLSGGMKESGQASMTGDDSTTETDEFHSKKPPIELKDVSYPVFLKVLEFLYTDTVTKVPLEMGVPLLIMSERFMLDRLKALCEDIIRKELNTENVIGIFIASHRHNASSLKEISLEIILKNLNHPNIVLGLSVSFSGTL
uniref:BTB domain-containing protein n=1 Tax=Attheya septentrionalis TaxID=420275 RepID=A0A7S2XIU6_9STRA|mmetsp:Transcript_10481/g.19109  ORF Transcript_10481/g.19109 Transcript_10481/m.19109 type:complete len:563 (+) Transcript_10481:45-1733(+)